MAHFLALAATAAAAALPTVSAPAGIADADIPGMVTAQEYPPEARAAGKSTAATIEIRVDTTGRPQDCRVVAALGDARLARDVCRIAAKKRYNPARLRDGTPAFAVVTTMVRLYLPGPATQEIAAARLQPAAEVKVATLRGNAASADVMLVTAVDVAGRIVECGPKLEDQRDLAEAICTRTDLFHPPVVTDAKGVAMPYIAETLVRAWAGQG
ncbi:MULTISPECIES: TonB family protein [Novosphingobium]|uniref:TonB family protein n=1 Tax=Novosphingobium TaxID=165696 RepID=UPI001CD61E4F|nr:TonB family protein [Novosphingobium percolationis]MCH7627357.1 TonB family protein [Pseudomonadota bacterium]